MAFAALAPNHAAFGGEQTAYLKSLLTPSGDPTADAVNRINLMAQANNDRGTEQYLQALREANIQQLEGANAENNKDIAQAYITSGGNLAKEGIAGAVLPNGNNPYLRVDPTRLTGSDAQHQQNMVGENVKNVGAGVKDLAEAGFSTDKATLGGYLTPSIQPTPVPAKDYLSPGNKAKLEEADAAKEAAAARMVSAKKGHGAGDGSTTVVAISDGKGGFIPISETTKTPNGVRPGGGTQDTSKLVPKHIVDPKTHRLVTNPEWVTLHPGEK